MSGTSALDHSPRVLVLQHAEPEHPGLIIDAVRNVGGSVDIVRGDLSQTIPSSLEGYAGLVIMGGPQSVYETEIFPYLRTEKYLAREAIDKGIALLGVCLGSQIIADVLDGDVRAGGQFEIGWRPVYRDSQAVNDAVFAALPESFTPLHWHGDIYDLPNGAIPIGSSDMTACQGFSYGDRVHALLFHLEMTEQQITDMAALFPEDVRRGGLNPEELVAETPARAAALRSIAVDVFGRWAQLLDAQPT